MSTETEKTDTTKDVETKEEKREFINVQVSKEQKQAITKHAIVNCGISVSEYGRTKMLDFSEPKKEVEKTSGELTDDERAIYEEGMKKSSERDKQKDDLINKLTAENLELKEILKNEPKQKNAESNIVIELTPEQRKIVDDSIVYETKSFFGTEYQDVYHFIKKKLGDLVTSNHDSFPDEYHTKGTPENKIAYDFIQFLKGKSEKTIS